MMASKTEIMEQVEADFAFMEEALSSSNPGIMDMLQVYGEQEAAVRQASDYLAILTPSPLFLTTDRSS
jgi:hypothetical protein